MKIFEICKILIRIFVGFDNVFYKKVVDFLKSLYLCVGFSC